MIKAFTNQIKRRKKKLLDYLKMKKNHRIVRIDTV